MCSESLFFLAIRAKYFEVIELLLTKVNDEHIATLFWICHELGYEQQDLLSIAVTSGNASVVGLLLRKAKPLRLNSDNCQKALILVAQHLNVDMLKALLAEEAFLDLLSARSAS